MSDEKHYYAFISHSSEDEKIALWLRDQLENYHIPTAVQKSHHAPKTLKPIFLYQTDIVGNNLSEALRRSLFESRYLIVICSPAAARSIYVNDEIQHFIDKGWQDRIIPLIVSGVPFVSQSGHNESQECFPPALRNLQYTDKEIRGINLQEMEDKLGNRMAAVVNVIATMLGVRFDALWDRYRKREIRRNITVVAVALLMVILGFMIWEYKHPRYEYYADYVDKWGVPEGVAPVQKDQQRCRHLMYEFEYRRVPFGEPHAWKWRVVRIVSVNSAKQSRYYERFPEEVMIQRKYSIIDIKYNQQDGTPTQWIYSMANGQIQKRHILAEYNGMQASIVDIAQAKERQGVGFADQWNYSQAVPNIVRYVYDRNKAGYITKRTYHANNDYNIHRSATCNADGIYGEVYTLDSIGRPIQISFLNKEGIIVSNKKGISGQRYEYDRYGNMTQIKTINENGELVWNDGVPPIINTISNNDGNIIEVTFRDTQGKLCFGKWTPYSKVVSRYDKRGNEIEKAYFDANGLPCETVWQGHKVIYKYDNKGDVKEEIFLGKDGNPFLTEFGAKIVYLNDENGNTVEAAHYGSDGQLFGGKDGVAIQRYKYNKDGNIIEMTYYDIQDQLCLCDAGYAKSTALYDENGRNWIEWAFYDSDGLPCLRNVDEVAKWCMKYDDRGNRIEYAYFDTQDNRCMCSWTHSAIERTLYDDRGKAIEESFWGCNEEPCYNKKGYHIKRIEYNQAGNILKQSFFGIDNQLCLNSDSIAQSVYTYDDRGNLIQETYWGIDGKPRLCKYGYAKYTAKYDNYGHIVEANFLDTKGKPCLNDEGISKFIRRYDNYGNELEVAFYGIDGKLCVTDFGGAICRRKYDISGNIIEESYFGTNGEPYCCSQGYAIVKESYNLFKRVETAYFGKDGKPVLSKDGIAKVTYKYGENGKEIERAYWGVNDEPVLLPILSFHKQTIKYDKYGNDIEYAFWGVDNKLCSRDWGIAKWSSVFNEHHKEIERTYYGVDDKPCFVDGFSKWIKCYNERGQVIEASYYDIEGNLCMITDDDNPSIRYARVCYQYNEMGKQIGITYYDVQGNISNY